jgi:CubicO group peptidase (beta-lactamase class C family)
VVEDGEVVYLKGFGVRKVGTQEKVDENTIFQLASVTKTFTSAAIGTFVDEGKVTWDDEVIDILPGFALMQPYPTRYSTLKPPRPRTGPRFRWRSVRYLGYDRNGSGRVRLIEPSHSFREEATYSNRGFLSQVR